MKHSFIFAFVVLFASSLYAQADQDQMKKALQMTQEMLRNPDTRNKEINTRNEKAADKKVKDVAGSSENEQAMYALAAEVFGTLFEQSHGDPEKMQAILDEAMKNPETFLQTWSPEEQQQLADIAQKIPEKKSTTK